MPQYVSTLISGVGDDRDLSAVSKRNCQVGLDAIDHRGHCSLLQTGADRLG